MRMDSVVPELIHAKRLITDTHFFLLHQCLRNHLDKFYAFRVFILLQNSIHRLEQFLGHRLAQHGGMGMMKTGLACRKIQGLRLGQVDFDLRNKFCARFVIRPPPSFSTGH